MGSIKTTEEELSAKSGFSSLIVWGVTFLLTPKSANKEKLIQRYNKFYIEKMDTLYKGILKNYSVQLADNLKTSANDSIKNNLLRRDRGFGNSFKEEEMSFEEFEEEAKQN